MNSLARRSIIATFWNFGANGIAVVVLFVRSILLARLLPVEVFGIYGYAAAIVTVCGVVLDFGLNGAMLHRAPETQDENEAATTHFTLKVMFGVAWLGIMTVVTLLLFEGPVLMALLVLVWVGGLSQLHNTPTLILHRRVVHRRLAAIQTINTLLGTGVALWLAWRGADLWALLATDIVTLVLMITGLYVWRPVWRPQLAWRPSQVTYYLRFGLRNFWANALSRVLSRMDDLWIGTFLGESQLGLYSRAYRFATYPGSIISVPVNSVAGGAYAELKSDRVGLSRAFYRTNALLVRAGFLAAGLLVLVAPEFIRLLLGEKWLPMIDVFRLMLIFTMLDPIRETVAGLFVAVGRPGELGLTRTIQVGVLAVGILVLGPLWGIVGVALAVNLMTVLGLGLLLWQARRYVDISLWRMFAVPSVGMTLGLLVGRAALVLPGALASDLHSGVVKGIVFCAGYALVLWLWERREMAIFFLHVRGRLGRRQWQ